MTPKKREKKGKEKESRNFRTETDLDEDERKKGKRKQELIVFSAHKLANLVLQVEAISTEELTKKLWAIVLK